MRRLAVALLLGCVALAAQSGQPVVALIGARVLDVDAGRYRAAGAVVLRGDRIEAVLETPQGLPSDAQRIDLAGLTLMPGLGDLHTHAAPAGAIDADYFYALALAHGVTFGRVVDVRLPWGAGQRDRIRHGVVLAPRIWIAGPGLEQRVDAEGRPQPRRAAPASTVDLADAAAAAREVAAQARAGVDWISVYDNVAPDLHKPLVAAARAAKLRISAAAGLASMAQLAQAGVDLIAGFGPPVRGRHEYERAYFSRADVPRESPAFDDYVWEQLGEPDLRTLVAAIVRARVAVAPMLAATAARAAPKETLDHPSIELLPEATRQSIAAKLPGVGAPRAGAALKVQSAFVAALHRAGASVVAAGGTRENGYPVPGAVVHDELRALVAAGLPPLEAIRAATVKAAAVLGAESSVGRIQPGFAADLVAVEGDPLQRIEDAARVKLVVRGGEVLDRADLLRQAGRATRMVK